MKRETMAKRLLGIDVGASETKAIVMDTGGRLIVSSLHAYDVLNPRDPWAIQWPEVWLAACNASIREVAQEIGPRTGEIPGIAVSGLYGGSGIFLESANAEIGESILVAGGAAKSPLWRQIIGDVTGHSIGCPREDAEANLGDVILAEVGTGCVAYEDIRGWQVFDPPVEPRNEVRKVYDGVFRSINPSTGT
jgi:sugar (pentulose or hexulose) kinase